VKQNWVLTANLDMRDRYGLRWENLKKGLRVKT